MTAQPQQLAQLFGSELAKFDFILAGNTNCFNVISEGLIPGLHIMVLLLLASSSG